MCEYMMCVVIVLCRAELLEISDTIALDEIFERSLEFFLAGASAIQIGTANFVNPRTTMDILDGIEKYLKEKSIDRLKDIVGSLQQ